MNVIQGIKRRFSGNDGRKNSTNSTTSNTNGGNNQVTESKESQTVTSSGKRISKSVVVELPTFNDTSAKERYIL